MGSQFGHSFVRIGQSAPKGSMLSVAMESKADMEALAVKLNPVIGFWDPLGLTEPSAVDASTAIAWLRHAEIKHGRVAMAAFVGFCVQSNGIHFPWSLTGGIFGGESVSYATIAAAGGPADQWDALPTLSKLSLLTGIGFLEWYGENSAALALSGEKHYLSGGKPGFYPSLKAAKDGGLLPHPMPLDLWDPFGFTKKMDAERKEKALLAEINNGRLAMIGIMGFMAAQKGLIVPGLDAIGLTPYSGEIMAPFTAADASLPIVGAMLKNWVSPW